VGKVLFILLPFPSHYFACFPYAKTLLKEGKQVIFTGSINQKGIIENEGFLFCEIKYTTEYSIVSFKVFVALLLQSLLDKTALTKRYREWYEGIQTINQVLQINKPAKVYIDDHLWHYYFVICKMCSSVEMINTKFSTKKSAGFPPLNSTFIPKPTIWSRMVCELLWIRHLLYVRLAETLVKMALLNRDEDYFVERMAKRTEINFSELIDKQNSFYKSLLNVNVLILAPPFLEFANRQIKPYERYLDIPIDRSEEYLINEEYRVFLKKINGLSTSGKKIIYCSFGTLGSVNKKKVAAFAIKLFALLEEEVKWQLIGGIRFNRIPNNVILFDRIPQLSFLKNCDLMITHGGLTSIKECIQQKIPMLVYPINEKIDQNGNAARVSFHGFGLRGKISSDSVEEIRKKIKILINRS
jgi:zeaxanthin glucosyltransferase